MSHHKKKYTLASRTRQRLNRSLQESIFFSSPKSNSNLFSPTLRCFNFFSLRTVRNRADIALNVNRFEQSVCEHEHDSFGQTAAHAGNIKIKRNLKKKGFIGSRTVVHLMKCVQVQKMRTTLWHKFFIYLFAFFARTVSLCIPSLLNFVNPSYVCFLITLI